MTTSTIRSFLSAAFFLMALAAMALNVHAASSANYGMTWSSVSTGVEALSTNYTLVSVTGQMASGETSSANYVHVAGFLAPPDTDLDLVKDFLDNCINVANTDQRDTNSDGYGNRCDPDFDGNLVVNFLDLGYMKSKFLTNDPDADLDGSGTVNFLDLGILKSMFLGPPGPSGVAP